MAEIDRESWVEEWIRQRKLKMGGYVDPLLQEQLEVDADRAWARRMMLEERRSASEEARRMDKKNAETYYKSLSMMDLQVIRRSGESRQVMTVTIPERMARRIEGVKKGRRSAYVTRLLARGWLWESGE